MDIASNSWGGVAQFPASWADVDPTTVLAAAAELRLEGIVCKHLDSLYTPGLRSRHWIKTPHRTRGEASSSSEAGYRASASTGTPSAHSSSAHPQQKDG
jgi:hypothetical protein